MKTFDMKYMGGILPQMLEEILINHLFIKRSQVHPIIRGYFNDYLETIKPLDVGFEKDWLKKHIDFFQEMRNGSLQKNFDKNLQKAYEKVYNEVFESLRDEERELGIETNLLNVDPGFADLQNRKDNFDDYAQASLNLIEPQFGVI